MGREILPFHDEAHGAAIAEAGRLAKEPDLEGAARRRLEAEIDEHAARAAEWLDIEGLLREMEELDRDYRGLEENAAHEEVPQSLLAEWRGCHEENRRFGEDARWVLHDDDLLGHRKSRPDIFERIAEGLRRARDRGRVPELEAGRIRGWAKRARASGRPPAPFAHPWQRRCAWEWRTRFLIAFLSPDEDPAASVSRADLLAIEEFWMIRDQCLQLVLTRKRSLLEWRGPAVIGRCVDAVLDVPFLKCARQRGFFERGTTRRGEKYTVNRLRGCKKARSVGMQVMWGARTLFGPTGTILEPLSWIHVGITRGRGPDGPESLYDRLLWKPACGRLKYWKRRLNHCI